MNRIRRASETDLARIAEIEVFNYRLYFYPIFKSDAFYFDELQVPALMERCRAEISELFVYDDMFSPSRGENLQKVLPKAHVVG